MTPSEAFHAAASEPFAPFKAHPHGEDARQVEALPGNPWISPVALGAAMRDRAAEEAALRHHVEQLDIAANLVRLEPPLTAEERVCIGIMLVCAAFVGFALAVSL